MEFTWNNLKCPHCGTVINNLLAESCPSCGTSRKHIFEQSFPEEKDTPCFLPAVAGDVVAIHGMAEDYDDKSRNADLYIPFEESINMSISQQRARAKDLSEDFTRKRNSLLILCRQLGDFSVDADIAVYLEQGFEESEHLHDRAKAVLEEGLVHKSVACASFYSSLLIDGGVGHYPVNINKAIDVLSRALDWKPLNYYDGKPGEVALSLGVIYYVGDDVVQDLGKAFSFFSMGAGENNKMCFAYLAKCYAKGEGTEKDLSKAKEYFDRAFPEVLFENDRPKIAPSFIYADYFEIKKLLS
jgi:hypothetical protein